MEIGGGEDLAKEALLQLHRQSQFVGLRSMAVVLLFVALWGLVLYIFKWQQIDLACIYPTKLVLWTICLGGAASGAPFLFITIVGLLLYFPIASTAPFREATLYTLRVIYLVFLPGDDVHFLEVLVGDILTSLSRVFQEIGASLVTFLQLYYGLFTSPISPEIVPISFASLPFLLRMRQCWVCLKASPSVALKIVHFLNIIKYCSSLPGLWIPIILSPHRSDEQIASIVLWYLLFNSLYSFAWDVVMDWGLGRYRDIRYLGLRQSLLFDRASLYYLAIVMDLVLRLLWVLKYRGYGEKLSYDTFMMVVEVLEVVRRSMWSVFRIEWECLSRGHTGFTPKPSLMMEDPEDDVELNLLEPHFA